MEVLFRTSWNSTHMYCRHKTFEVNIQDLHKETSSQPSVRRNKDCFWWQAYRWWRCKVNGGATCTFQTVMGVSISNEAQGPQGAALLEITFLRAAYSERQRVVCRRMKKRGQRAASKCTERRFAFKPDARNVASGARQTLVCRVDLFALQRHRQQCRLTTVTRPKIRFSIHNGPLPYGTSPSVENKRLQ